MAVLLAPFAWGCDVEVGDAPDVHLRSADVRISGPEEACTHSGIDLALEGRFDTSADVLWRIVDSPSDASQVPCLAGVGPDAVLSAAVAGEYVIEATVLSRRPYSVTTELFVADCGAEPLECMADGIVDADDVSGIDPTPFEDPDREGEVSGIDPTPFAWITPDGASVSAGCFCGAF